MSLQEAAQNVNMSKKTLDEYYNQIKEGKKFGFDFNRYKRDKVNVLRGFVKKKKEGFKNGSSMLLKFGNLSLSNSINLP